MPTPSEGVSASYNATQEKQTIPFFSFAASHDPPSHGPFFIIMEAKWGEVPTFHKTRSDPPYNPPGNVTSNCPPHPSHTWHQRLLSAPWPRALCWRRPCRVFGRYSEGIRGYSDGLQGIRLMSIILRFGSTQEGCRIESAQISSCIILIRVTQSFGRLFWPFGGQRQPTSSRILPSVF